MSWLASVADALARLFAAHGQVERDRRSAARLQRADRILAEYRNVDVIVVRRR